MAGVLRVASFADESVVIDVEYDDSFRVFALRCANNSASPAYCLLKRVGADGEPDGTQYGKVFDANKSDVLVIPTAAAQRITLAPLEGRPGKFTGYAADTQYPWGS